MIDLWHLTQIDWLRTLATDVTESLRQSASLCYLQKGDSVFSPVRKPDDVYILESGLVRIYRESADATEVTFGFIRSGEIFGECALFDDLPRESHAVAMEDSVALRLSRDTFAAVMRSVPYVGYEVAKQIEGRFKNIESRVEDLVFRNVHERLAHILVQLGRQYGRAELGQIVLPMQLTQKDLATLIGASRPTVSLALQVLQAAGHIQKQRGRIRISDLARLQAVVDTRARSR